MSGTPSGYDSPPTTSTVVRSVTSSSALPPRRSTTARASLRPSDHSFPVKTTVSPRSGCSGDTKGNSDIRSRSRWSRTAPKSIYNQRTMILAGDVGGTKTLIGLFQADAHRPVPVDVRTFSTTQYPGLPEIISAFLSQQAEAPAITSAAFGVAGPVINQHAQMTNVAWAVDAAQIGETFNLSQVHLLNDLEAMAHSVPVLMASELKSLQGEHRPLQGNVALIAAGTGLGEALLHYSNGSYLVIPSEGGHADFAPRTDREVAVAQFLRDR